jgi:alcohol-forming fatty acyl-CoA reductase
MSVHRSIRARSARAVSKGAAFYDLDGTLAELNLMHSMLFILANLGEWSGRISYLLGFAARIPTLYRAEQRDRYLLNVMMFEMLKGVSRDRLDMLGEEYCERVLVKHLYPHALELLEANRAAGLEPVLVTGSPEFIVAPLAERLRIDNFAANRLVFTRDRASGRLREPVMAGDGKANWCMEYAETHQLDLGASWGYADSHYDLPFLAALGHPVAVNPDNRLLATARTRQWPIVRFARAARGNGAMSAGETALEDWIGRALNGAVRS